MSVTFTSYAKVALAVMELKKDQALEVIGGMAESYAKRACPVDTGRLRNSITHRRYDENTEVIGTNVEYAPYVELGTSRKGARPFLRPAAEGHTAEYTAIIKSILGN